MPELPEVETIKQDLEKNILHRKITDFDILWSKTLKEINYQVFKKKVVGQSICDIQRRAKLIIVTLSNKFSVILHMKMTGHLLITSGTNKVEPDGSWSIKKNGLEDPYNQYIRAIFWLDSGNIIAFSDLRKFGYIKLASPIQLTKILSDYGPEPFNPNFNKKYLGDLFSRKSTSIKKILMDQGNIAGIGNIYADEILFASKVHPEKVAKNLGAKEIDKIIIYTKKILSEAIRLRGTSSSDYRDTAGKKGLYEDKLRVYRRTNQPCFVCKNKIKRIVVSGRGTHYCPNCQVLND